MEDNVRYGRHQRARVCGNEATVLASFSRGMIARALASATRETNEVIGDKSHDYALHFSCRPKEIATFSDRPSKAEHQLIAK